MNLTDVWDAATLYLEAGQPVPLDLLVRLEDAGINIGQFIETEGDLSDE